MPPLVHVEAQPAQGPLDQGVPQGDGQGHDGCERASRRAGGRAAPAQRPPAPFPCDPFAAPSAPQDATFEVEKRRNAPVRYDRELVANTVRAMKRIDEIRSARAARYHEARMKGSSAITQLMDRQAIAEGVRLVPPRTRRAILHEAATAVGRTAEEAAQVEATLEATGIATIGSLAGKGGRGLNPSARGGAAASSSGFVADDAPMGGSSSAASAFDLAAKAAGAAFSK